MTDTGRREQMGSAAEELASLRGHLDCLLRKAERCKGACRDAMSHLDRAMGEDGTGKENGTCERDTWPSYDEIASLFKDISEARSKIQKLENQLREWGVIR